MKKHLLVLILTLIVVSSSIAGADDCVPDETFVGDGSLGVYMYAKENGTLYHKANGSGLFSVYVVTQDNYQKLAADQPFGYIDDLSVLNTTYAEVTGEISYGRYYLVIMHHEYGETKFCYNIDYPDDTGLPIELIAVSILAALLVAETFLFWQYRKKARNR